MDSNANKYPKVKDGSRTELAQSNKMDKPKEHDGCPCLKTVISVGKKPSVTNKGHGEMSRVRQEL
jgi:hypothetical protein